MIGLTALFNWIACFLCYEQGDLLIGIVHEQQYYRNTKRIIIHGTGYTRWCPLCCVNELIYTHYILTIIES